MFKKIYVYLVELQDMQINAPHLGTNLTGEYTLEYPSAAFPSKHWLKE